MVKEKGITCFFINIFNTFVMNWNELNELGSELLNDLEEAFSDYDFIDVEEDGIYTESDSEAMYQVSISWDYGEMDDVDGLIHPPAPVVLALKAETRLDAFVCLAAGEGARVVECVDDEHRRVVSQQAHIGIRHQGLPPEPAVVEGVEIACAVALGVEKP